MEHFDLPPLGRVAGNVSLPGSKSISNRLLLLAALGLRAWRRGARIDGVGLLLLTVVQLALGPALVAAGLPITLVLAHNLLAALLLALLARLV